MVLGKLPERKLTKGVLPDGKLHKRKIAQRENCPKRELPDTFY